jgi:DNA helicase-2/ATP-dependent DNA helicase PcrA
MMRVINEPKRGIGGKTLAGIEEYAKAYNITMYEALCERELLATFGPKLRASVEAFTGMLSDIRQEQENLTLSDLYDNVLNRSGYLKALEDAGTVEAESRIENIMEFKSVIAEFEKGLADGSAQALRDEIRAERLALMGENIEADEPSDLSTFLEQITLMADIDNHDEDEDAVVLMTLHSAKGLEFPVVFMPGMENGMFPGLGAFDEEHGMEEERRLCYVGITRAMKKLYLTGAQVRTVYGRKFLRRFPGTVSPGCGDRLFPAADGILPAFLQPGSGRTKTEPAPDGCMLGTVSEIRDRGHCISAGDSCPYHQWI